jgi:hypothetical protein
MTRIYRAYNGPAPTAAAQVAVTTGTAIKTMLQLQTPSTVPIHVMAWGVTMFGAAAAAGPQWELITTNTVAATVTAHVAAGLVPMNAEAVDLASQLTLGTSGTGYTSSAEGTVTGTTRQFDTAAVQPTGTYVFQRPLGTEWYVPLSTILRVRVTAAAAVNAICWVEWTE